MSCLGGHHVAYVEEPERATTGCACGANPLVVRSVMTGGNPRVFWLVARETIRLGRLRKEEAAR